MVPVPLGRTGTSSESNNASNIENGNKCRRNKMKIGGVLVTRLRCELRAVTCQQPSSKPTREAVDVQGQVGSASSQATFLADRSRQYCLGADKRL